MPQHLSMVTNDSLLAVKQYDKRAKQNLTDTMWSTCGIISGSYSTSLRRGEMGLEKISSSRGEKPGTSHERGQEKNTCRPTRKRAKLQGDVVLRLQICTVIADMIRGLTERGPGFEGAKRRRHYHY